MFTALRFLTVLPAPGGARNPKGSTLFWFPIVGVIIGVVMAATFWAAHQIWPPLIAAGIIITVDIAITGALHFDGLADSADALMAHMQRERRLTVLSEPTVGVFAVVAVGVALLIRFSVLAESNLDLITVALIWAMSRTMAATIICWVPYARSSGLASGFLPSPSRLLGLRIWLFVALIASISALFWHGQLAAVLVGVALIVAALAVTVLALRRIGGFTGDVIGAAIVISETVALVALSAVVEKFSAHSYFEGLASVLFTTVVV